MCKFICPGDGLCMHWYPLYDCDIWRNISTDYQKIEERHRCNSSSIDICGIFSDICVDHFVSIEKVDKSLLYIYIYIQILFRLIIGLWISYNFYSIFFVMIIALGYMTSMHFFPKNIIGTILFFSFHIGILILELRYLKSPDKCNFDTLNIFDWKIER